MVTLKNLYLKNFMSVSELEIDFEEDTVISISGQNGSGKSTLIYAIAFALTGYRKGESYRNYIKTGCDTAVVVLDALLKGYPLNIEVEIRNLKNFAPIKRKVVYKDVEYLNSDYTQFMKEHELDYLENVMFLFQGNDDIIKSKPAERAAILKHLFQLDFSNAVSSLKEKQESVKSKLIESNAILKSLESKKFEKQPLKREVLESVLLGWNKEIAEINNSLNELQKISITEVNEVHSQVESLKQDINGAQNKVQTYNLQYQSLEHSREKLEEEIKEYEKKKDELEITYSQSNIELEDCLSTIDTLTQTLEEHKQNLKLFSYKKSQLDSQIKVSSNGTCHACGQPITEDHIKELLKEQVDLEIQLKEKEELVNYTQKELSNCITQKENLTRKMKEIETQQSTYQSNLEKKKNVDNNIQTIVDNISSQTKYLEILKQSLNTALEKMRKLDTILPLVSKKDDLLNEKNNLESRITEANSIRDYNKQIKLLNEHIEAEEKNNEESKKTQAIESNNLTIDLGTIKTSIDIFENLFPNYVVLQACKQLEDYINSIIQKLFPYMSVSLKQNRSGVNFYYTVEEAGEELPVCMASGAQGRILSLAYSVALAKMYGINCILIDEVDASMTPENAGQVYEFIASLEDIPQIIFISHREEAREAIRHSCRENLIFYEVNHGNYNLVD